MKDAYMLSLGDGRVGVEGPSHLVRGVRAELSALVKEDARQPGPDLHLKVRSSREPSEEPIPEGVDVYSLQMNPNARLYPSLRISVHVGTDPLLVEVIVDEGRYRYQPLNWRDRLADAAWKGFDRSWMSRLDQLTYSLINSVLEPLALFLLPRATPLIHAAGIAYNDSGFLLAGTGGAGKTTTATRILEADRRTQFLSDDMALTDATGRVHFYPRRLLVYRYNVEGSPSMSRRLLEGRSIWDRTHWKLHRSRHSRKMARRRVSAARLFGRDRICRRPVGICAVYYLHPSGDSGLAESTSEAFADRMASIMVQEEHLEMSQFLFRTFLVEKTWREAYVEAVASRLARSQASIVNLAIPDDVDYGGFGQEVLARMKACAERRQRVA